MTDRRAFLAAAGLTGAAVLARGGAAVRAEKPARNSGRIKAVAFDGFPIIDPGEVARRAEALFPGRGEALMNAWRTRQFEYTWLRTLTGNYEDFWHTTEDALRYAASSLRFNLSAEVREELMGGYLKLKSWPDARAALDSLRSAGLRMAFLSNLTPGMLDAAVANSELGGYFEPHLSTDRVRAYKPDPRAYEMGIRAFGLPREEIVFCASAGWDAAGARLFGYRTFWVNRTNQPPEELGRLPDGMGSSLADLARFILG